MKATVTINSRGIITLTAKLRRALHLEADHQLIAEITREREREFDAAESALGAYFRRETSNRKPTGRAVRSPGR